MTFFGCVGCAIAAPLWFFGSPLTESYAVVLGMLHGVRLAGFVPLSDLMPSMVDRHDKGAALAILNTGAGAAFIGLAIPTALAPLRAYRPGPETVDEEDGSVMLERDTAEAGPTATRALAQDAVEGAASGRSGTSMLAVFRPRTICAEVGSAREVGTSASRRQ